MSGDDTSARRDAVTATSGGEVLEAAPQSGGALTTDDDLPVVARLVVEIRSDGRRTVARGGVEDHLTGERVALHAVGASPLSLAGSLAKALFQLPVLAARGVGLWSPRRLLGGKAPR